MTTAVLVNPYEIKNFKNRIVNPSHFLVIGKRVHRLAKIVKKEWHNFDQKDREFLGEFAYDLIEPNNSIWQFPQKIWSLIYLLIIKITGQEKEFLFCVDAVDCLVDNILDAIETENIDYQHILSETLKEVKENSEIGEFVNG